MLNEDRQRLGRAYRRAAIGLAIAAILWSAAFVVAGTPEASRMYWLIPISAAALSVFCFSLYSKSKNAQSND